MDERKHGLSSFSDQFTQCNVTNGVYGLKRLGIYVKCTRIVDFTELIQ